MGSSRLPISFAGSTLLASTWPSAFTSWAFAPAGKVSVSFTRRRPARSIDKATTPGTVPPASAGKGCATNKIQRPVNTPRVTRPSVKPPEASVASR